MENIAFEGENGLFTASPTCEVATHGIEIVFRTVGRHVTEGKYKVKQDT